MLEVARLVHKDAVVTTDSRYCMLTYPYVEGDDHMCSNPASFKNILVQLHEIHEKGYGHSDVRLQNIVFGETSKLIDFDLADKE